MCAAALDGRTHARVLSMDLARHEYYLYEGLSNHQSGYAKEV